MSKGPEEQRAWPTHYCVRNIWGLEYRFLGSGVGEKAIRSKSKTETGAMNISIKMLEFIMYIRGARKVLNKR